MLIPNAIPLVGPSEGGVEGPAAAFASTPSLLRLNRAESMAAGHRHHPATWVTYGCHTGLFTVRTLDDQPALIIWDAILFRELAIVRFLLL